MRIPALSVVLIWCASSAFADVGNELEQAMIEHRTRASQAQAEFNKRVALATRVTVRRLEQLAAATARKGDNKGLVAVWKQVLKLDRQHAGARRYFEGIGNLATILRELDGKATSTVTAEAKTGIRFDGEGWIVASSVKYDGRSATTFEAIVTPDEVDETGMGIVANIHNAGLGLMLEDGAWQFLCHDGSTYRRARSDESVKAGETVHIAGVYDGRTVRIYVNGILQKTTEQMTGPHKASPHPVLIGADPTSSGRPEHLFKGTIHAVRISSAAQYQRNFSRPTALAGGRDTIAVWKLDEGEGEIARDSSGNGHHARVNDATWVGATN